MITARSFRQRKFRNAKPIVCYVTDGSAVGIAHSGDLLMARIEAAIAAGVDWIQIREKDLSARELFALAGEAVNAASNKGARVLVNDRLDIAFAAAASGVHLREESVPVYDAAQWRETELAHTEFLIGVSCHSVESARQAAEDGANYVLFGPVFETPAKRKFGRPQGIEKLAAVCNATSIPVIAIGGIDVENASKCIQTGAAGVAAIRLFQNGGLRDLSASVARIHSAS